MSSCFGGNLDILIFLHFFFFFNILPPCSLHFDRQKSGLQSGSLLNSAALTFCDWVPSFFFFFFFSSLSPSVFPPLWLCGRKRCQFWHFSRTLLKIWIYLSLMTQLNWARRWLKMSVESKSSKNCLEILTGADFPSH